MRIIRTAKSIARASRAIVAQGETLALVPTMGYLHAGHLALVKRAKKHATRIIVSIFVNPAQFSPSEDLSNYPRNTRRDLQLLRELDVDLVYMPNANDVYPAGFSTYVEVKGLTDTLEGKSRPDHFRGVTTIVAKLFNVCRPDVVVFGQKDFQQAAVLQKMTSDLDYPLKFIVAPTIREKDGLALSSRNVYFNERERREAVCLYRGLVAARRAYRAGEKSGAKLRKIVRTEAKKVCPTVDFDYAALTDSKTLKPLSKAISGATLSTAAKVHGVRLIDNFKL
ncbi:pantoate--beta-alanine ligase [Gemmatimonas aurantiaca]|nr:pantoate--beta-alanine ligase [Gemmatimonas aurantiaca]